MVSAEELEVVRADGLREEILERKLVSGGYLCHAGLSLVPREPTRAAMGSRPFLGITLLRSS